MPCNINNQIQCLSPKSCLEEGGQSGPRVYACDNHGTALGDGTCVCDSTAITGDAYVSDYSVFARDNCFGTVQCATSLVNQAVCGQETVALADPASSWVGVFPDPVLTEQIAVILASQGIDITARAFVQSILSQPSAADLASNLAWTALLRVLL